MHEARKDTSKGLIFVCVGSRCADRLRAEDSRLLEVETRERECEEQVLFALSRSPAHALLVLSPLIAGAEKQCRSQARAAVEAAYNALLRVLQARREALLQAVG